MSGGFGSLNKVVIIEGWRGSRCLCFGTLMFTVRNENGSVLVVIKTQFFEAVKGGSDNKVLCFIRFLKSWKSRLNKGFRIFINFAFLRFLLKTFLGYWNTAPSRQFSLDFLVISLWGMSSRLATFCDFAASLVGTAYGAF